jgi:hypothetical protein
MRKTIAFVLLILSILAAGAFADTAIIHNTPLRTLIIQLVMCAAVMVGALWWGRLWEYNKEDNDE